MCKEGRSAHGRISPALNAGAFPHDSADPPMTGSGRMCNSASTSPRSAHPAPAALAPAPPGCSTPIPQAPRVPRASVDSIKLGSSSRGTRPGRAIPARTHHRPARALPRGTRPGRDMALWEDRSAPHPTAPPPEPRNYAETAEHIRGAGPNDPPRTPKPATVAVPGRADRAGRADQATV